MERDGQALRVLSGLLKSSWSEREGGLPAAAGEAVATLYVTVWGHRKVCSYDYGKEEER